LRSKDYDMMTAVKYNLLFLILIALEPSCIKRSDDYALRSHIEQCTIPEDSDLECFKAQQDHGPTTASRKKNALQSKQIEYFKRKNKTRKRETSGQFYQLSSTYIKKPGRLTIGVLHNKNLVASKELFCH
jgi:hypothetical protein